MLLICHNVVSVWCVQRMKLVGNLHGLKLDVTNLSQRCVCLVCSEDEACG